MFLHRLALAVALLIFICQEECLFLFESKKKIQQPCRIFCVQNVPDIFATEVKHWKQLSIVTPQSIDQHTAVVETDERPSHKTRSYISMINEYLTRTN